MEYLKIDREFPRLSKSAVTLGKFDADSPLFTGDRQPDDLYKRRTLPDP